MVLAVSSTSSCQWLSFSLALYFFQKSLYIVVIISQFVYIDSEILCSSDFIKNILPRGTTILKDIISLCSQTTLHRESTKHRREMSCFLKTSKTFFCARDHGFNVRQTLFKGMGFSPLYQKLCLRR